MFSPFDVLYIKIEGQYFPAPLYTYNIADLITKNRIKKEPIGSFQSVE